MTFVFRRTAERDILRIVREIADNNPLAARAWRKEILEACETIGNYPHVGTTRDDVRPGLRTFPKGNYLIIFRPAGSNAIILRVVHAARDWPKLIR